MTHTEQEADKLWCPMARDSHASAPGDREVVATNNEQSTCKASRCMMWRWVDGKSHYQNYVPATNQFALSEDDAGEKPKGCEGWEFSPFEEDPAGWVEPVEQAMKRRRGYCGLASSPELNQKVESVIRLMGTIADRIRQ